MIALHKSKNYFRFSFKVPQTHIHAACVCMCVCVVCMDLNDIIRANESSYPLSLWVCAPLCVYVCMSHADLGTHKHHMTPVDKWKMAQSPTPDVTMCVSLREREILSNP